MNSKIENSVSDKSPFLILSSGTHTNKMKKIKLTFNGKKIWALVRQINYSDYWATDDSDLKLEETVEAIYRTSTGIKFIVKILFRSGGNIKDWELLEDPNRAIAEMVFRDIKSSDHNLQKGDIKMANLRKELAKSRGIDIARFKRSKKIRLFRSHLHLLISS